MILCRPLSRSLFAKWPMVTLEELKKRHFTPEGKEERIDKALAALYGDHPQIDLPIEDLKRIAEDPDLEDSE